MARSATRTVTIKRRAEMATIELRAGETTLGALRGVAGTVGDSATMTGQFTHAPAYADFTERFLALGDGACVTAMRRAPQPSGPASKLPACTSTTRSMRCGSIGRRRSRWSAARSASRRTTPT